jgi:hypothetical protein
MQSASWYCACAASGLLLAPAELTTWRKNMLALSTSPAASLSDVSDRNTMGLTAGLAFFHPGFCGRLAGGWPRAALMAACTSRSKFRVICGKQRAELAQAEVELSRARSNREAQSQQLAAELREQYLTAQQSAKLLEINHQGLIPHIGTGFQAGLAAYQGQLAGFSIVADLKSRYPARRLPQK